MNHVFYIHSSITYLVIKEVINYEKIDQEDIFFIINRDFKLDFITSAKILDLSYLEKKFPNKDTSIRTLKRYISYVNELLDKHLKKEYIAYLPTLVTPLKSLIVTHKLCANFNYVEEGIATYVSNQSKKRNSFIPNLKLYVRGLQRIKNINKAFFQLNHPKLLKCYTVSPLGFKNAKNKIILSQIFKNPQKSVSTTKRVVIIFDALLIRKQISKELFFSLLEKIIIPFVKNNYDVIYFKFHPEQYTDAVQCNKIRQFLNSNIDNVVEFQSNVNLEKFLIENTIDVVNYASAAGFYACFSGNQVYTVFKRIEEYIGDVGVNPKITKMWIDI